MHMKLWTCDQWRGYKGKNVNNGTVMQIETTSRWLNFMRTLLKVSVIVWGDCGL